MRAFTDARDWGQFHDPKSLILALTGEVGELAELFQWLPAEPVPPIRRVHEPLKSRVGQEFADILIYLVRLADVLGIDLAAAATRSSRPPTIAFHQTTFSVRRRLRIDRPIRLSTRRWERRWERS